jgi:hypothetical protein
LRGQTLFCVRIDPGDQQAPGEVLRDLFQDWLESLARTAPGRPEIDQYRHLARFAQYLLREIRGADIKYVRTG